MGKFKKGLLVGGAVGAFLTWLNVTPKGKELRSKMLVHADALYGQLKESIEQLDGPTKEMYEALVERAVAEYSGKKDMATDMKNKLVKELKKRWDSLQKDLKK
jgi:gas vesicle protein